MTSFESQQSNDELLHWFALRVKPRHEVSVASMIEGKGLEKLLPLHASTRRWSDRTKIIEAPLFPGYVFCRFTFAGRLDVLRTPGVRGIVSLGSGPTPIPDEEIRSLCTVLASGGKVEPISYLHTGQKIRICEGPLAGAEGVLEEIKNKRRLVVSINLLQRSVAVELESGWVVPGDDRLIH